MSRVNKKQILEKQRMLQFIYCLKINLNKLRKSKQDLTHRKGMPVKIPDPNKNLKRN